MPVEMPWRCSRASTHLTVRPYPLQSHGGCGAHTCEEHAELPAQALHSSSSDASGSSLKREAEELISRGGCLQSPEGRALYVKLVSRDGAFCERLELSVLAEMLGNEVNACTQWLVDRMETGG